MHGRTPWVARFGGAAYPVLSKCWPVCCMSNTSCSLSAYVLPLYLVGVRERVWVWERERAWVWVRETVWVWVWVWVRGRVKGEGEGEGEG